jgi:hypothetical protein
MGHTPTDTMLHYTALQPLLLPGQGHACPPHSTLAPASALALHSLCR